MSGSDRGLPGVGGALCVFVLSHAGVQVCRCGVALCVTERANPWFFWMLRARPGPGQHQSAPRRDSVWHR